MNALDKMIAQELHNASENGYYLTDMSPRDIALDLIECTGEYTEYSIHQLEMSIRRVQTKSKS